MSALVDAIVLNAQSRIELTFARNAATWDGIRFPALHAASRVVVWLVDIRKTSTTTVKYTLIWKITRAARFAPLITVGPNDRTGRQCQIFLSRNT